MRNFYIEYSQKSNLQPLAANLVEHSQNAILPPFNKPIGVATYSFYQTLPENMRSLLPSPDEIANIIGSLGETDES